MIFIVQTQIYNQLAMLTQAAYKVKEKFVNDSSSEEIEIGIQSMENEYEKLKLLLPKDLIRNDNFDRHLRWMKHYVFKNNLVACKSDIDDILRLDILGIQKAYELYVKKRNGYDTELIKETEELVSRGSYDSAIRKAFVILSDRLRLVLPDETKGLDGEKLVNKIFIQSNLLGLDNSERQSLRNMLVGMYSYFRNDYGHNNAPSDVFIAEAVLSMINVVLKKLNK